MHNAISRASVLYASVAITALLASAAAHAGGFANRQQSVSGQGASYAGVAAGGAPSSMFWNPAIMTQFAGMSMEMGVGLIFAKSEHGGFSTTLAPAGFTRGEQNSNEAAATPSSYRIMQLGPNLWAGVSTNNPFGLSTGFDTPNWAGAAYGQSTSLRTYNAAPSIAWKVTDWLSVGGGAQIQYGKVNFQALNGLVGATPNMLILGGSGWGFGWTAGVTLTPMAGTTIGVGYRSVVNQEIDGGITGTFGATSVGPANATVKLPDMLTVGIRHRINAQFTALGGFEWTRWSRIGTVAVTQANGTPSLAFNGTAITLPFQYVDGYFYSGGLEYICSPTWTVRAGFAYEQTPITDQVRTPRLPDNDRYWYSIGATNNVTSRISIDLAYSYVDVVGTPINITAASGNPWFSGINYVGTVNSSIHILSIGFKLKTEAPAPII